MRILHLVQRYHPAQGGAERHMEALSTHLAAAGHDVTVATTDALDFELFWEPVRRRVTERESQHDGVRILRFPIRHLPYPGLSYPALRRLLWLLSWCRPVPVPIMARLARFTPWVPDLWRWLETTDEPFDLVAGMTITFEPLLAAGQQLARRRGIPFVCYPLTHLGAGRRPAQDSLSRFYTMRHQVNLVKESDTLVAQTAAEQQFYIGQGMAPSRIVVGGPGVDPDQILGGDAARFRQRYRLNGPIALSIASMCYDKGTITTVEAIRKLWAEEQDVALVLIGAVLEPFQRYLDQLPPADRERICLLGSVDETVKRDALAAANLLAVPSRTDSFGIVYLEAWLYGKPVIGAQSWGVADVIQHRQDGLLVPFGDAAALAAAIRSLLTNPVEAAEMGARGRQKVYREHTWPHKCRLVDELYHRLTTTTRSEN